MTHNLSPAIPTIPEVPAVPDLPTLPDVPDLEIAQALARGSEGAVQIQTAAARLHDAEPIRRDLRTDLASRIGPLERQIKEQEGFAVQYLKRAKASLGERIIAGVVPAGSFRGLLPFLAMLAFGAALFFFLPTAELINNLSLMLSGEEFPINKFSRVNQLAYVFPFAVMVPAAIEMLCYFLPLVLRKPIRALTILVNLVFVGVALWLFAAEMTNWVGTPDPFEKPPASKLHWLILFVNLAAGGVTHLGVLLLLRGCGGLFTFKHCETEMHVFHREQLERRVAQRTAELAALNANLGARVTELTAINEVSRRVMRIGDLQAALDEVAQILAEAFQVGGATISLFDAARQTLQVVVLADRSDGSLLRYAGYSFAYTAAAG